MGSKKNLTESFTKNDLLEWFDNYLKDNNIDEEEVSNEVVNDFFTDIFYEIEDEDMLDASNEAEHEIRAKYNLLGIYDESKELSYGDLEDLATDLYNWLDSDMGTHFDAIQGNEEETYGEILNTLETKDAEQIQNLIDMIEEADIDNETAKAINIATTESLLNRLKALLENKEVKTEVKTESKIKTLKLEDNKFVADIEQDDTIGEIKEDGTVIKEYYGQGLIYKNFKNFEQKSGPCYIAEYQGEKDYGFHDNITEDELKTKNFNDMVEGEDYETYNSIINKVKAESEYRGLNYDDETIEDTAREIFYEVDWQNVSSLLDEWLDAEEEAQEDELDAVEYAVNIRNKNTNDFISQYDCYETYDEALKSAKAIELKDDEIYEIVQIKYDENGNELGINNITDSTLEESYSLVGIYTDEHGMEKRDIIKSFENKEDIDKYMEENEEELKAKNYDKMITEGFELDDEETKFINNMVAKTKTEIEDFLGYDLTEEQFDDKQGLRLAVKEIYEQMPNEELNKFEEVKSVNKLKENRQYKPAVKTETKQVLNRARRLKTESTSNKNNIVWTNGFTLSKLRDDIKNNYDDIKETIDICYIDDRQDGTSVYLAKYNGELYLTLSEHNKNDFDDDFENVDAVYVNKDKVANSTEAEFTKYINYLYKYLKGLQHPIKLKTEGVSNNIADRIYEADSFDELFNILDNMEQDAKVQRARNLTSHAYTHISDEEEDEELDTIKDQVADILTESFKEWGVKLKPEFIQSFIDKMVDNLGISKYDIQKEGDAIKFRYDGKVYFAEPVSMSQVDIFDDNHNQIGYGVIVDNVKEEIFTDYITNNDYIYDLVGGEYAGTYTREEAEKLPIKEPELTDDLSDTRANGGFVHRKELDNQLQFKGYLGPMWNGTENGKAVLRYETQEVYDMLSR